MSIHPLPRALGVAALLAACTPGGGGKPGDGVSESGTPREDSAETASETAESGGGESGGLDSAETAGETGDGGETGETGEEPARPPNFVFILGEARGWTSASVAMDPSRADSASELFLTPNLEEMAGRGMVFSDFHAPSPRCMPSRAAVLTGKSPARLHMTFIPEGHDDGTVDGEVVPPDTVTTLPTSEITIAALLAEQGYATAHFGKWHVGNIDPGEYGFEESDGPTTNKGPDGEESPNPEEGEETAARGVDFMTRQVEAGRPFYLQISHYGGDDVEDASAESYAAESARLAGESEDDICEAACIADMDEDIGTVLDALDALGIRDQTYILFSSDHGRSGKKANQPLAQGKGTVYEGGIRVPLIVEGPGIEAGSHSATRASQVDLFPTLAELAGADGGLPEGLEGGSLVGVLRDGEESVSRWRDEFVVHFPHYDKDELGPASTIISGDLKLIRYYEDGSLRLFDLSTDLEESEDLAESRPDEAAALEALMDDYLVAVDAQMPGHL